ncbi:hypothetical protein A7U60_g7018 [Sanghuangporus baumii]|uniref:Uncharacterized protein n=1 Tax=Sanghuangporus baumii TaxID=108892 RepID=A0A9Q5HTV0_SANBA|nr:hypothetical protein A7U60_g7018 [Sanghuangporus baumii]
MDAILDRALLLRGVTGVLVLKRDSWLTIASRGALNASDAPTIERLLSWMDDEIDATGSIPWMGGEGGRCIHFHFAETHTLILLRQYPQPRDCGTNKTVNKQHLHPSQTPGPASPHTPSSAGGFASSLHAGLSGLSFSPRLGAPRMRFGWSRSSTESHITNASSVGASENVIGNSLRAGTASLFDPSRSVESAGNVHRPSSWC